MLGKPASYYPLLGRVVNGVAAGLFLNFLIYDQPPADDTGLFSLSDARVYEVTGINKFELATLLHTLTSGGIIAKEGTKYRVHWHVLEKRLAEYTEVQESALNERKTKDLRNTLVSRMGDIFVKKYADRHPEPYILTQKDYGQLKNLKEQLEKRCRGKNMEPTYENVLNSWTGILDNLPEFYAKTMSPATIYGNFSVIINQISKTLKDGQKNGKSLADIAKG